MRGFLPNCDHVKSKKCLPEVVLPQLFPAKSWETILWSCLHMLQVHVSTARSPEILEGSVSLMEKNNMINYMEEQLVSAKHCCSPSHNISSV